MARCRSFWGERGGLPPAHRAQAPPAALLAPAMPSPVKVKPGFSPWEGGCAPISGSGTRGKGWNTSPLATPVNVQPAESAWFRHSGIPGHGLAFPDPGIPWHGCTPRAPNPAPELGAAKGPPPVLLPSPSPRSWTKRVTHNHVLQGILGQPAVQKHGNEQIPQRRPEYLQKQGLFAEKSMFF